MSACTQVTTNHAACIGAYVPAIARAQRSQAQRACVRACTSSTGRLISVICICTNPFRSVHPGSTCESQAARAAARKVCGARSSGAASHICIRQHQPGLVLTEKTTQQQLLYIPNTSRYLYLYLPHRSAINCRDAYGGGDGRRRTPTNPCIIIHAAYQTGSIIHAS